MIFSYCKSGKTARECHDGLFLGSEQLCKLSNIQKNYRLFNDGTKEKDMVQYLANSKSRGPQLKDNNEQWYDDLVGTLNTNYPTLTTLVLRQHLDAAIGGSSTEHNVPSTSTINPLPTMCADRHTKTKRPTFLRIFFEISTLARK